MLLELNPEGDTDGSHEIVVVMLEQVVSDVIGATCVNHACVCP